MVQASSVGATMYTYFLLRDGNSHVKWWPVCKVSPAFCSKVLGATIAGALGLLFNFTLMCYAVYIIVDPLLHYADQRG
ncbi:unnamed protein product [Cuscuta epithymum]|uniref:CASP-like protein n=1 Tax=Cuscuta epithymum TaxID=186058 RepID=A0AAV0CMC2_9ASTE|nr:unnamed protein product [Cuscuta epithymum]